MERRRLQTGFTTCEVPPRRWGLKPDPCTSACAQYHVHSTGRHSEQTQPSLQAPCLALVSREHRQRPAACSAQVWGRGLRGQWVTVREREWQRPFWGPSRPPRGHGLQAEVGRALALSLPPPRPCWWPQHPCPVFQGCLPGPAAEGPPRWRVAGSALVSVGFPSLDRLSQSGEMGRERPRY